MFFKRLKLHLEIPDDLLFIGVFKKYECAQFFHWSQEKQFLAGFFVTDEIYNFETKMNAVLIHRLN